MMTGLLIDDLTVELSDDFLLAAAHELDANVPEQRAALIRLAGHYDYEVRAAVASKQGLNDECYLQLASDTSVEVVAELLNNASFHRCVSPQLCQRIAARDPKLAYVLAQALIFLDESLQQAIGQWLLNFGDRKIKHYLATESTTPLSILHTLADDADPGIALAALASLGDKIWSGDETNGDGDGQAGEQDNEL